MTTKSKTSLLSIEIEKCIHVRINSWLAEKYMQKAMEEELYGNYTKPRESIFDDNDLDGIPFLEVDKLESIKFQHDHSMVSYPGGNEGINEAPVDIASNTSPLQILIEISRAEVACQVLDKMEFKAANDKRLAKYGKIYHELLQLELNGITITSAHAHKYKFTPEKFSHILFRAHSYANKLAMKLFPDIVSFYYESGENRAPFDRQEQTTIINNIDEVLSARTPYAETYYEIILLLLQNINIDECYAKWLGIDPKEIKQTVLRAISVAKTIIEKSQNKALAQREGKDGASRMSREEKQKERLRRSRPYDEIPNSERAIVLRSHIDSIENDIKNGIRGCMELPYCISPRECPCRAYKAVNLRRQSQQQDQNTAENQPRLIRHLRVVKDEDKSCSNNDKQAGGGKVIRRRKAA